MSAGNLFHMNLILLHQRLEALTIVCENILRCYKLHAAPPVSPHALHAPHAMGKGKEEKPKKRPPYPGDEPLPGV